MKHDKDLKSKVSEATELLNSNDLKGVGRLLQEIDLMLGKHDAYVHHLTEVFTAMADFDFGKKLPLKDYEDGLLTTLVSQGINWLNEEFEVSALHKNVVSTVLDTLGIPNLLLLMTDVNGAIKVANKGNTNLANFDESTLSGLSVHMLFEDFASIVDKRVREGSSTKNIPINLKWHGKSIPSLLNIGFSFRSGKIEACIYWVRIVDEPQN